MGLQLDNAQNSEKSGLILAGSIIGCKNFGTKQCAIDFIVGNVYKMYETVETKQTKQPGATLHLLCYTINTDITFLFAELIRADAWSRLIDNGM